MTDEKLKETIRGGIYEDDSPSKWWHYYLGDVRSGNYRTKAHAEKALQAQFDQAIAQFGDKWEVTIERKDL